MTHHLRKLFRDAKNKWYQYDEAEVRVREATSNDAWGASSSLLNQIAEDCSHPVRYQSVMAMLWRRLSDEKHFRHVLKSLVLVDYLLRNANKKFVHEIQRRKNFFKKLQDFKYWNDNGEDIAGDIRTKVTALMELIDDDEALETARNEAAKTKGKIYGIDRKSHHPGRYSRQRRDREPEEDLNEYFSEDSRRSSSSDSESIKKIKDAKKKVSEKVSRSRKQAKPTSPSSPSNSSSTSAEEHKFDNDVEFDRPTFAQETSEFAADSQQKKVTFDDMLNAEKAKAALEALKDREETETIAEKADDFLSSYTKKTSTKNQVDLVTGNNLIGWDFFATKEPVLLIKPAGEKDDFIALFDEPVEKPSKKKVEEVVAEEPELEFEEQVLRFVGLNSALTRYEKRAVKKTKSKGTKSLKQLAVENGKEVKKTPQVDRTATAGQMVVYSNTLHWD